MFKKIIAMVAVATMSMGSGFAFTAEQLTGAQTLAGKGVIKAGVSGEDFALDNTITRKEIMKIVLNLSGKAVVDSCNGDFGDVTNDWGCKYIEAGLRNGFIAANDSFRPDDSISKAEAMKLILKAKDISKAYETSDWQADYMNTAYDNSIVLAKYSDHGTKALRGWIFEAGAAEKKINTTVGSAKPVTVINGYKEYQASLVGTSDNVVLFFHADWCPSCVSANTNIQKQGVSDFLLLKVDYDSETSLRKQYGVTTQHTFVQVNRQGGLIKKWSGGNSVDSIKQNMKSTQTNSQVL